MRRILVLAVPVLLLAACSSGSDESAEIDQEAAIADESAEIDQEAAIAEVRDVWGDCLDAAGVSLDGATVQAALTNTIPGDRGANPVAVTLQSGEVFIVQTRPNEVNGSQAGPRTGNAKADQTLSDDLLATCEVGAPSR